MPRGSHKRTPAPAPEVAAPPALELDVPATTPPLEAAPPRLGKRKSSPPTRANTTALPTEPEAAPVAVTNGSKRKNARATRANTAVIPRADGQIAVEPQPTVSGNGHAEHSAATEYVAPTSADGNGHAATDEQPTVSGNGHTDLSATIEYVAPSSGDGNGHVATDEQPTVSGNGHAELAATTEYIAPSSTDGNGHADPSATTDYVMPNLESGQDVAGSDPTPTPSPSRWEGSDASSPAQWEGSLPTPSLARWEGSTPTRPRHYPRSHTGVKHGARALPLHTRMAMEQRATTPRNGTLRPHRPSYGRIIARNAAATKRYPMFMMRQRNGNVKGGGGLGLRLFITFALLFFITFGAVAGGLVGGFFVYARDLPSVNNMTIGGLNFETTKIYDRNGVLLTELFNEGRRTYVTLDKISKYLIDATVSTEDASFYTNIGVEPVALVRAVLINFSGSGSSGASTITQQLVRSTLLSGRKYELSLDRKMKEAILAVQVTQRYSKDKILEMYLNEIYYGNLAYGIEAASESYFGKHANELTLPEAAMLAGLPQSPSYYDPTKNWEQAKKRQGIVLNLMAQHGYITASDAAQAVAAPLALHPPKVEVQAPHFVQYVKEYLEKNYGADLLARGGLVVTTTLDLKMQAQAEQVARTRIDALRELSATNAAMVVMKPDTGEILAMVGSVDYNNVKISGQVNVATSERQPGSSIKPIIYSAAFQKGWNPATSVLDVDTIFGYRAPGPYRPHNYDKKDHGWVTVRTALANSYNIPAVKALQFAGLQNAIDLAHSMGIKTGLYRSPDWYGLTVALGGGEVNLLELTNAYATLANSGREVDATPILRITDSKGNVLQAVDPHEQGKPVVDPGIAYQIASILSDNQARSRTFGVDSPLKVSFPAAVKTGTTDDNRDSWTLGFTPNLVVGVWVGNTDNTKMQAVTGAKGAAYLWHDFMEAFYKNPSFKQTIAYNLPGHVLASDFTKPNDVVKDTVCTVAKGDVTDYFIAGKVPTGCKGYKDPPDNKVNWDGFNRDNAPKPTPTPAPPTGNSGTGGSGTGGTGSTDGNGIPLPPTAAPNSPAPPSNPNAPLPDGGNLGGDNSGNANPTPAPPPNNP